MRIRKFQLLCAYALSFACGGALAGDTNPHPVPTAAPAPLAAPAGNTPVAEVTFVAFDTETTGLSPRQDRLVELAAVKFRQGRVLEEKTWLINPGQPIPPAAEAVHHISNAMVRHQPDFKAVYPEFERFIRGTILMAHQARFDVAFISAECARHGLEPPPNPVLDTLPLFRHWFPTLASHSIASMTTNLNLAAGSFHRALSDTMYMVLIFGKGCRQEPPGLTLDALFQAAHPPLQFTSPPR